MQISVEINSLLQEAYLLFSSYVFGDTVAVHYGMCCLSNKDAQLLKTKSIKEIDRHLIYEYLDAEEENDQYALALQVKFLLPKILEFLVQGESIHHSYECIFDKCRFNLTSVWKSSEIELMNRFALCFFKLKMMVIDEHNSIDSFIIMFHRGGLNVQPLLEEWLKYTTNHQSLINLISMLYYNFKNENFTQPFADESLIKIMNKWYKHLKNNDFIIKEIVENLTSHEIYPQYCFMIDSIFDQLK